MNYWDSIQYFIKTSIILIRMQDVQEGRINSIEMLLKITYINYTKLSLFDRGKSAELFKAYFAVTLT